MELFRAKLALSVYGSVAKSLPNSSGNSSSKIRTTLCTPGEQNISFVSGVSYSTLRLCSETFPAVPKLLELFAFSNARAMFCCDLSRRNSVLKFVSCMFRGGG